MTTSSQIECTVRFYRHGLGGHKALLVDTKPGSPSEQPERVPRLARLMALALRFETLIRSGQVKDYAALARLGRVSRARISQIMNLLQLAPDIQEQILFLRRDDDGREWPHLRQLQPIAMVWDWQKQRHLWRKLLETRRKPSRPRSLAKADHH